MLSLPIIQQNSEEFPFSWGSLVLFDLFLLAILILATRLATFLHELMGHTLMAVAFGGHVDGIRVSLFGGGHAYYRLNMESGLIVRFLVSFGGIIVNLASGLLPLICIRRLGKRPGWDLFLILFAIVSLLGAIAYCALGFYYDQGDPVAWLKGASQPLRWLWVPFLIISPIVSYFAIKSYIILNETLFPARSFLGRSGTMFITLGITVVLYAGLYGLTGQSSVAVDSPSLAFQRAEDKVRETKKDRVFRKIRESHPELSEAEVRRLVERTPIIIRPDEVPKKFPLKPVIAALYAIGALFALGHVRGGMRAAPVRITPRTTIPAVISAGVALGLLVWREGWI